ncbi:MAG: DUF5916 domain-containing protein [Weeksellaceae bacterium]
MLRFTLSLFTFMLCISLYGQTSDTIARKKIHLIKVAESPKIDGILDDAAWQNAPIATDFVERIPNNGRPIPDSLRTEVKIVYDDLGIYFGAKMYDPEPDKILKELTERDGIDNDDFFFILLNGYNDHQQSLQFIVTAAGVQYDAKMTNGNEDASWNGVWYSDLKINTDSWVVEIFIPYSEIRFPKKDIQVWGLQMEREFRRTRTRYSWNHVDNTKGGFSIYDGEIHGIQNIDPPVRLSFLPYLSSYLNNYNGKTDFVYNGGMDLKYGINDAFTLDMILIPDFGQTKFDPSVLNLSAFEVQYEEQRPFFTEGIELFNKGDLFYSRRVGGRPGLYPELAENEEISEFPAKVDLINAMKISGRTGKNLGIGMLNAVTERAYAKIKNTDTGASRKEIVEPLTNYNVLVLDQRFGQNNSVSFVNTNTMREGHYRDANVSGIYFDVTNKQNTLNFNGNAEASYVKDTENLFGMEGNVVAAKINGKHRLQTSVFFRTKDYDIDDLGYTGQTNYINYYAYYGYRLLKPKGAFNTTNLNLNLNFNRRLEPDLYNNFTINFNADFQTKKFFYFGGGFETAPFGTNDIYEPRAEGRFVKVPAYYNPWAWISTDYRKRFALDVNVDWYKYAQSGREKLILKFSPRFRVSDKWKLYLFTQTTISEKEQGFVGNDGMYIFFGERNRNTVETSLESQYIFNDKMALSLAFRHYFTDVVYDRFFTLLENGELSHVPAYTQNHNATYNSWNIDLRFNWWFAPGSQLTLLYRNALESYNDIAGMNFHDNFDYLFSQPQLNSISLRISYYLDFNHVKNLFHEQPQTSENIGLNAYHDFKNYSYKRNF